MEGINSAIDYKGQSFHIQTQDQGLRMKYIESLIYKSGKLLTSRKTPYTSLLNKPNLKDEINKLMREQHQTVINEISQGKLDHKLGLEKKEPVPAKKDSPRNLASSKLESETKEKIEIKLLNFFYTSSSSPLSLTLEARMGQPPAPLPFMSITVHAVTEFGKEHLLFEGLTDESGKLVIGLTLPRFQEKRFILSIKGEKENYKADELKVFLKKD